MMPNNHMADRKKYNYRGIKDAPGYKITKRTTPQLMKALNDIYNRGQNPQTATGNNYDFLARILKGHEDWLEPNASDNN